MNKNLYFAMGLVVGAASAVFATRKFFRDKYEQQAQEEIDSVKESFDKLAEKHKKQKAALNAVYGQQAAPPKKPDLAEYTAKIQELGYASSSNEPPADTDDIEVISPDEYAEDDEYDAISFTYYSDGVLADDNDRRMDEEAIADSVGSDAVNHFGEYEDDIVYVRNDRLKVYYEICRDERPYAEVLGERPYLEEDE